MSPAVIEAAIATYVVAGGTAGLAVGLFLEEIVSRKVTLDMRVAAGLLAALAVPLLLPAYVVYGLRNLYRAFRPKATLPEARIHQETRS